MNDSEFNPTPSGKGTNFYQHLANWGEFLAWFSAGLTLSFLVQILPKLVLVYPLAFVLTVGYFASCISSNPIASILRIIAVVCSLVGFWNLAYLYRDTVSAVVIGFVAVICAIGGLWLWQRAN